MCDLTCKVKVTWHIAKYGDPYSEFMLCIYPSKCTHSSEHTHTHTVNTHPEQWAAIYAAVPWEQLEIRTYVFCAYHLPESDRRSAKATANGKRCNISPVHRSPSHPLRREVLWGKRGSPAEGHWDVCSLTYVFWFSINWRENSSLRRVQWGRLIWRSQAKQVFVFRRHKSKKH